MLRPIIRSFSRSRLKLPFASWVLLAFFLSYFSFFVKPVFLSGNTMRLFQPVPAAGHLGIDLKLTLSWANYWVHGGVEPDAEWTIYPPLSSMLLIPLLPVRFATAYALVTLATLMAYTLVTLVLPLRLGPVKRLYYLPVLIWATGLISYGLQFELERGQFSVIAVCLAILGIWIFRRHRAFRYLGYVLFTIAVQLKLYPFIFILLFVDDWRDWRGNARRLVLLILANLALLLASGPQGFLRWLQGVRSQDIYVWVGNASIASAVSMLRDYAEARGWEWFGPVAGALSFVLMAVTVICLFLILLSQRRGWGMRLSSHYLTAAAIGCILIPATGHDYRLAILGGPVCMLVLTEAARPATGAPASLLLRRIAVFVLVFAYSSTLFSHVQKPYYLANNFPALFAMLILVTLLAVLPYAGEHAAPGIVAEASPLHR